MQISKMKLGVYAVALCCSVAGVLASDDTPGQAAARAALYKRMQQADSMTNPPTSTVVGANDTPAQAAARAALYKRMQQADSMANPPASTVVDANDTPAQAAARAALMKRMQEADAAGGQPILINSHGAVPPENTATMTPAQIKSIEDAAAKANTDKMAAEQANAEQKAAAEQAAKAQMMADAQARKAADQQAADAAAKAKQAKDAQAAAMAASYPGKEMGFQRPPTPRSPISAEKQAKLDNLLIQYKADQISPEEYHRQRAAILAEP